MANNLIRESIIDTTASDKSTFSIFSQIHILLEKMENYLQSFNC